MIGLIAGFRFRDPRFHARGLWSSHMFASIGPGDVDLPAWAPCIAKAPSIQIRYRANFAVPVSQMCSVMQQENRAGTTDDVAGAWELREV